MDDYLTTEAYKMIYTVCEVDLNKYLFCIFIFNRNIIKLFHLNVKLLFSICISLYFSIMRIRKYVIKILFITSVAQVHGLVITNDYNS